MNSSEELGYRLESMFDEYLNKIQEAQLEQQRMK